MKGLKYLCIAGFLAVLIMLLSGCPDPAALTGVSLDTLSVTLPIGGTILLTATVEAADAANAAEAADLSVTWTSSDEAVATVSAEGLVTGVADGAAVVTAATSDGVYSAACDVTVDGTPPAEVTGLSSGSKKTSVILTWTAVD